MATENERSLQRRPELVPENLMQGGLIVGVEPGIQGSLMSVTGAAIERITRERTEVPPQFKLPERPVYFLDPNTRRLIMISNRENRGENKTPDKYGLFAEIVELDEEGKPHYRLSSSEIILPDDNYHLVAVGPNSFGLPPSHIEVTEEEEGGKKKFVPWNIRLAELQNWMTQVTVNPDESLDEFLSRFAKIRADSKNEVDNKITQSFPGGNQGFDDHIVPINLIVTVQNQEELRQASIQAGLYPAIFSPDKINEAISAMKQNEFVVDDPSLTFLFDFTKSAVITIDNRTALSQLDITLYRALSSQRDSVRRFLHGRYPKNSPTFAMVWLPIEGEQENLKLEHGSYYSYNNEEYRGLLNKIKADLLLTMFLRGGAPIVK